MLGLDEIDAPADGRLQWVDEFGYNDTFMISWVLEVPWDGLVGCGLRKEL